jgi:primase-polymerase (primpol)-like protein
MFASAIAGLRAAPQWFVWRLTWVPADGKYKKQPAWPFHRTDLDYNDDDQRREGLNAQSPANWRSYDDAVNDLALHQARLDGYQYALGFMLTADLGYWFLDVDGCVLPDGTLTPWAAWFHQNLPGAFLEYSSSGKGLHFVGRGQVPEHRTRPTAEWKVANPGVDLEFYTGARGIAFGLNGQAWGSADSDHTVAVQWIAANIFTADVLAAPGVAGAGPRADWRGPTDDADLLRRAMAANKSAAKTFNGFAGFADLWTRNLAALCKTYPNAEAPGYAESEADFALAVYLAFWTGCDAERMHRLMLQSALVRPKWSEHRTYLRELTIERACRMQTTVCQDKEVVQQLSVATSGQASATRQTYFDQIMSAEDDAELRNEVIPAIAADRSIEMLDRDFLAAAIKKRFNEWLFPVSINECREMLRTRAVDDESGALVPEWANRHVYVLGNDEFFDLQTARPLSRTAFNAQYNRSMPARPNGDREDASKWCLERWNMATVAEVMYWPGKEPVFQHEGVWYANDYSPATLPETATEYTAEGIAAIDAFLNHVRAFCDGRTDVYLNMLDWMAWVVQNPGRKCRYMPLLKGVQGDGKTMIIDAIRAAMGWANVGSVGPNLLTADFNDWAEGTCVTGFEEMMITGRKRYSVANSLKEPIANSALSINRKGRASGVTIVNVTNYIGFTNHVDAVPLEDSDRRYWVIFSRYQSKAEVAAALGLHLDQLGAYFAQIFDSFQTHRGQWRKFLTEYTVSDAFRPNGDAPYTAEKGEMRSSGEDVHEAIARQIIEAGGVGVGRYVLSSAALTACMRTICVQDGVDIPKTSSVNHMLSRMGFSQYGSIWWDGKMHRVWWKRGSVENKTNDTIRSLLELSKVQHQQRMAGV